MSTSVTPGDQVGVVTHFARATTTLFQPWTTPARQHGFLYGVIGGLLRREVRSRLSLVWAGHAGYFLPLEVSDVTLYLAFRLWKSRCLKNRSSPSETANWDTQSFNIFLIGCGGTGSFVTQHLARLMASGDLAAERMAGLALVDFDSWKREMSRASSLPG